MKRGSKPALLFGTCFQMLINFCKPWWHKKTHSTKNMHNKTIQFLLLYCPKDNEDDKYKFKIGCVISSELMLHSTNKY